MIKFTNANIYRNSEATEILVKDGIIQQIGNHLPAAEKEIDLKNRLIVPPYVDSHLHLDYVYTGGGDDAKNASGTLFEGIARWHDVKKRNLLTMPNSACSKVSKKRCPKGCNIYGLILISATLI